MRRALVVLLAIGCGSSKSVPTRGPEADALWALAPANVEGGVVITAHGVAQLQKAFVRLRSEIATYPEFAPAKGQLAALSRIGLDGDKTLADLGLTTEKGFAMFGTAHDALMILPVSDRAKFVAAMHGTSSGELDSVFGVTCKQLAQGYACAKDPALFGEIAKGSLVGKVSDRGDAEIYMSGGALDKAIDGLTIAVVLDDGIADLHAFVASKMFALPALDTLPPDPKGGGFLIANLAAGARELPPDLLASFKGPVEATMSTSAIAFLARVPLAKVPPVQELVEHCDRLDGYMNIRFKADGGVCHADLPAVVPMSFEAWIEDGELRIAQKKGAFEAGGGSERTAIGKELAGYPFAVWGRGSVFALHLAQVLPAELAARLPDARAVIRAFSQVAELGVAARPGDDGLRIRAYVRTTWANPAGVADGIAAISAEDALDGKGDAAAAKLAAAHPDSPLAADLGAGPGGLMMPTTVLGILSAVAIPAYLDYMKKAKETEASLKLKLIAADARTFYIANARFPKGQVGPTPSAPCCAGPNAKCPAADWSADVWKALDFQIAEPTRFQYSYASDGATFTATAVGDLDCDGTFITYTATGTVEQGNPHVQLSEPPPDSD